MNKAPWMFHLKGDPRGIARERRTGAVGCTILDIFSPPRAEYKKAGAGFGNVRR